MDLGSTTFQPYMFEPESDAENEDAPEVQHPRMLQEVSQWCTCGNCAKMPTGPENVCCREIPQVTRRLKQLKNQPACMVDHPGLEPVCLNEFSLQKALNIYNADHGPLRIRGKKHRSRFLARWSFVSWCWGFLGRRIGVVLPACVVLRIQEQFPDADALPGDAQQQQQRRSATGQRVPRTPSLGSGHIKKEEEETWTSQQGLQVGISLAQVAVKREEDEETPQSSQLHQIKTEDGVETEPPTGSDEHAKTETAGPPGNPDPNHDLQQKENDENNSDSSETEISDEDYWKMADDSDNDTVDSEDDWK